MQRPQHAPPGWYPTPDGSQQYWDGQQWLAIPPPNASPGPNKRARTLIAFIASLVVAAVVGGGIAMVQLNRAEQRAAAEQASSAAASHAAAEEASVRAAEEAASVEAAEHASAEVAARAEEDRDEQERQIRAAMVPEIEASVQTMAEEHITDGLVDAIEVLSVTCSPVAGGSIGDLEQETTVFECFVATEDNGDGTMSGFGYNATMNWTTGSYTYALGEP